MRRSQVGASLPVWRSLREAALLLVSATLVMAGLVVAICMAEDRLGLSKAWVLFGGGALVYNLSTLALLNKIGILRLRTGAARLILATAIAELLSWYSGGSSTWVFWICRKPCLRT